MCDNFDDFDDDFDGEYMEDEFGDDDQTDGFNWDVAYWSGVGLGFADEEGRRKRRKRKDTGTDNPPDID